MNAGDASNARGSSGDLDAARIVAELQRRDVPLGRPLVVSDRTASTNDDAKRAAEDGAPSGAAFVADTQTQGRGRLGRTWHSPPGENLYASFVVRPALDVKRLPLVTLASGLAVAEALAPFVPRANVAIKWPNDVLIDDRKVAGILSEGRLPVGGEAGGTNAWWIVIGIGINVRTTTLPPDLVHRATSLALAGATLLDRSALFVEVATKLAERLETLRTAGPSGIVQAIAAKDALAGRRITVDGASATAMGISHDGTLRIRRDDGSETSCIAGDVQLGF